MDVEDEDSEFPLHEDLCSNTYGRRVQPRVLRPEKQLAVPHLLVTCCRGGSLEKEEGGVDLRTCLQFKPQAAKPLSCFDM